MMHEGEDKFTWDVQYADPASQESGDRGDTSYIRFAKELTSFPWMEQLDAANEIQETSPGLSVIDWKFDKKLWVCIFGDRDDFQYAIGYTFHV